MPVLGACVIGPHYIVRKYEDLGEGLLLGDYAGAAIAAQAYPKHKSGEPNIDTATVKVFVKDAQLEYADYSSDYDFSFADTDRKSLVITDSNSNEVEFQDSIASTVDVAVGDIVKIVVGGVTKTFYVRGIEKDNSGNFTRCVLSAAVDAGTITEVKFYRIVDCYMKSTYFTPSATTIAVSSSAKSEDIDLGGGAGSYTIAAGKVYAEYRFRSDKFTKKYGMVSGIDYVEDMLGAICPENPLGIAVANAVEESAGNFVYFVAIAGDPTNSDSMVKLYEDAADLIADKDGIYGIVPCTDNKKVTLALLQYIEKQSAEEIPYFKYLYASKDIPSDSSLETNSDIIDALVDWKNGETDNQPIANKRCSICIGDGAMYNSLIPVPNYCVAAALAGRRSGAEPHAPLSNVKLKAITTAETHGFTASQSKKLGAAGFWSVGMNENGECISRRQLTSMASGDVNYDEQSIVCNIDSIGLSLKTTGRNLVGNSNISPVLIDILEAELNHRLSLFMRYADDFIGPQLLSGSVISIKQDAVYKDRIYAELEGEPPKPFNRFHITFYMR